MTYEIFKSLVFNNEDDRFLYSVNKDIDIWLCGLKNEKSFSKFVFDVYVKKHKWIGKENILERMIEIDSRHFSSSFCFLFKSKKGQLLGTAKLTKKTEGIILRTEQEYDINLNEICTQYNIVPNEIWHVSRLSVDKEYIKRLKFSKSTSALIFFEITKITSLVIATALNNVCFAELGEDTLSLYKRFLGVNWRIIGEPLSNLGIPGHPVLADGEEAKKWLIKRNFYD